MTVLLLVCICLQVKWMEAIGSMGPVGKIVVNSIYDCPKEEQPTTDFLESNIELGRDDNDKWMDASIVIKQVLDDNAKFDIDLQNFANGKWEKFYTLKGKLCTDAKKFIPKLWEKLIKAADPSPGDCPFQPGNYSITKFIALAEDLKIPSIFYGAFKLKAVVHDKSNNIIFCHMGEGESFPP